MTASSIATLSDIFITFDTENGCGEFFFFFFFCPSFHSHNNATKGDLIYSGHTLFFILGILITVYYLRVKYIGVIVRTFAVGVILPLFCCATVLSRRHYSVDVFIALYVSVLLWLWVERFLPVAPAVSGWSAVPAALTSVANHR